MSQLDFHPSHREHANFEVVAESLHTGRIDPKLLYATGRQADLWRRVFLRHSPIHHNPEFARIYRDAFAKAVDLFSAETIWLIGLGAGTGLKEAELVSQLKERGRNVIFSAIDISSNLVREATESAMNRGASLGNGLVGDLADTEFLEKWLAGCGVKVPRLFTFFGLVPNLAPSVVVRLFHSVLRPGDVLFCSAHLAPVSESMNLFQAMKQVLPQYDNPETLAWLSAALEEWGLQERLEAPRMNIGEVEGVPAFVADARWKSDKPFERCSDRFSPRLEVPLQLFHSLRYTPSLFEQRLRNGGFNVELLAQTACREEAIWSVTQA